MIHWVTITLHLCLKGKFLHLWRIQSWNASLWSLMLCCIAVGRSSTKLYINIYLYTWPSEFYHFFPVPAAHYDHFTRWHRLLTLCLPLCHCSYGYLPTGRYTYCPPIWFNSKENWWCKHKTLLRVVPSPSLCITTHTTLLLVHSPCVY